MLVRRSKLVLRRDIEWGIQWGAGMAAIFSGYVIVMALIRRSAYLPNSHVHIAAMIIAYVVSGVTAGAATGWLRPINATKSGRTVIGIVAAIPAVPTMYSLFAGAPTQWRPGDWMMVLFLILFLGPLYALYSFADVKIDKPVR